MTGNIQLLPNSQVIAETYLPPNQNTTLNAPTADYTEGVTLYVVNNSTFSTATVVVNITSNGNRVYTNSYFLPAQNGSMLVNLANLNDSTITISIYGSNDCYGYLVYNSNFILEISNAFSINNSMFPNSTSTNITTTDSVSAIIEDFLNNNTSILTDIISVSSDVDSLSATVLTDIIELSSNVSYNKTSIFAISDQQLNNISDINQIMKDITNIDDQLANVYDVRTEMLSSQQETNISNISALSDYTLNLNTQIDNISSQQNTNVFDISVLFNDVSIIDRNIISLSAQQEIDYSIIFSLSNDIAIIDTNIANMSSQQETNISDIRTINNDITNIDDLINNLSTQQTTNITNISTLSNDISNIDSEITNINSDLSILTTDIKAISSDIDSLDTNVSSLSSKQEINISNITSLSNDVSTIDTHVSSLSSQQETDQTNISTLSNDISNIDSEINTIVNEINTIESVINVGGSTTTASPTSGSVVSFNSHNGTYKINTYYLNGYGNSSSSNQVLAFPTTYAYLPIVKNFAINSSSSPKSISVTTTGISLLSSDTTTYTGYIQIEGF